MQVKRRINQFFENILRKDKKLDSEEASGSGSKGGIKRRWRGKSQQTHSQWDLIDHEHIAESLEEEEEKIEIANVQLQLSLIDQVESVDGVDGEDLIEQRPKESFLKRSGSLLRRSMRRKKKPKNVPVAFENENDENFTSIVQQINETLNEVAALGGGGGENRENVQNLGERDENEKFVVCHVQVEPEPESRLHSSSDIEGFPKSRKETIKVGLKRQASKLASKFQKAPGGSLRLQSAASFDSLRDHCQRPRSSSFSEANIQAGHFNSDTPPQRNAFRRTMSFKSARKFMKKGVTSFGKNMMHASAVMPIAYETPPASFYPDYENTEEYPSELANCYYRTLSYQPRDQSGYDHYMGDKAGGLHGQQTVQRRPTGFYQHGYCYNG